MSVRDLFDLQGRVAIVTGGATGIGLHLAHALAEGGADVVLCARNGSRCEQAARELGGGAFGMACDVRLEEDINRVVDATLDRFDRIDILVNNAGTVWSAPPEETTKEQWEKVIAVNLTAPFQFSQRVGREMIAAGRGGRIVNIASIAAFGGAPAEIMDTISYQASKGGIVNFTKDLACKWAPHNITVNAIAPGWFPSDMTRVQLETIGGKLLDRIPMRRFGAPEELKGAVVFLASEAGSYVTGHTLVVDGGWTAW
jgi:gluconate 5-dehydrogenase